MASAFVFVQLGSLSGLSEARAVHDAIHAVSGVKTVHFVAGPTDVIVFVESADTPGLTEAVGRIRSLKGVASTDTRIVMAM